MIINTLESYYANHSLFPLSVDCICTVAKLNSLMYSTTIIHYVMYNMSILSKTMLLLYQLTVLKYQSFLSLESTHAALSQTMRRYFYPY